MIDERYKFRKGDLIGSRAGVAMGIILYHHLGCFEAGTTYVNILWIGGERVRVDIGTFAWDNTEVLSRA